MKLLTIILFFVYTWGTGFTASYFLKNSDNFFERNIMRIGLGLGILPFLVYVLNLFRVPIDWRIYAVLGLIFPILLLLRKRKRINLPKLKLTKPNLYILVVTLIFFGLLFMFLKGSFAYPWLEDGDPWNYAVTAKYIATFRTTSPLPEIEDIYKEKRINYQWLISGYNEPYPQGYPILMGLLAQTNSSVSWTLKFFNSLIISLAIVFFYFFAKEFIGDSKKALFSTFVLAAVPAFLSHFIYSQALAAALFLPAFYALERIKHDRRWLFIAVPIIASILMTQSSSAGTFGALFFPFYWLGKAFVKRKFMTSLFLAGILGLTLAFAFWGVMIHKYTWTGTDPNRGHEEGSIVASGLPGRFYYWNDFYTARKENKIDNPVGLGPIVFVLLLISFGLSLVNYKHLIKTEWLLVSFVWVIINFANIHGNRFPVNINPHRGWSFFAIALAIFVSYGTWQILGFLRNKANRAVLMTVIVALILITSAYPKYVVNTVQWPTHYFASLSDIPGYMWLENLPDNTMATSLCRLDEKVIGMDMYSTKMWDLEQLAFQEVALNKSTDEIYSFLKKNQYSYMVLDSSCVQKFGVNKTNERLREFMDSDRFLLTYPTHQEQPMSTFIFRIA